MSITNTSKTWLTALFCLCCFLFAREAQGQAKFEVKSRVNGVILSQFPGTYIIVQRANNVNNVYTESAGITVTNGVTTGLVKDDQVQTIHFEDMLQVLNFMAYNGWKYVGVPDKDMFKGFVVSTEPYLFRRNN